VRLAFSSRRITGGFLFSVKENRPKLGGLIKAGFVIDGFYEDRRPEEDGNPVSKYMPSYYVVRAHKIINESVARPR